MDTIASCQKFLTQLKSRILTIKIGVIFLDKNLFFFATLNWVFKCHISACRFLYAGFYCVALTDLRGDFVRVPLVSGAKFVF